ncbi:hypothetical protein PISMIDRAFT_676758 [Pisolithus microcarpus 441]|uniref:Uncharacterized protein n=1 Tax=Pisolithus microcarpus 441 TaxID=765257 RepID=A0A0C9ZU90_9AGAM|nr:hypothetical protein PISMIDRAFT_676758 [Pisolithus microcarpus 441]
MNTCAIKYCRFGTAQVHHVSCIDNSSCYFTHATSSVLGFTLHNAVIERLKTFRVRGKFRG